MINGYCTYLQRAFTMDSALTAIIVESSCPNVTSLPAEELSAVIVTIEVRYGDSTHEPLA